MVGVAVTLTICQILTALTESMADTTTTEQPEPAMSMRNLRPVSADSSANRPTTRTSTTRQQSKTKAVQIAQSFQSKVKLSLKNLDISLEAMKSIHGKIEVLSPRFELPLRLKDNSTISPSITCRLLALPRELRDEIYRELLVPGLVILPGGSVGGEARRWRFREKPQYAIAAVNKQVRSESLEIYFQENHLVANCTMKTWEWMAVTAFDQMRIRRHGGLDMIATHLNANLTSISIAFDVRDLDMKRILSCADYTQSSHQTWTQLSSNEQVLRYHQEQSRVEGSGRSPLRYWAKMLDVILQSTSLHTLGLDVSYARCTGGCCRLAIGCADLMARSSLPSSMRKMEILGTKTSAERTAFVMSLISSKGESKDEQRAHITAALNIKLSFKNIQTLARGLDVPRVPYLTRRQAAEDLKDVEVDVRKLYMERLALKRAARKSSQENVVEVRRGVKRK